MTSGHRRAIVPVLLAVLAAGPVAFAQTAPQGDLFRPVRTPRKGPPPPPVAFDVVARIPLDAPLVDPRLAVDEDGRVIAGLDHGRVAIEPIEGGSIAPLEDPDAFLERTRGDGWVIGGRKGKLRFRFDEDGVLQAQKRSRSASAWSTKWALRIPGTDSAPPLAVGRRLYVGASDNRVYAMKARNGHRLWVRDLGARAVRPLAAWSGVLPERDAPGADTIDVELLLVPRGDGASLEALDPHDGKTVGTFAPEGGDDRLQGGPAVLPDGRVAIVRRGWRSGDIELLVLAIRTATAEGPEQEAEPPAPVAAEPAG